MKERPILFKDDMVRAILEDRKTQTRRVFRWQPIDVLPMKVPDGWVTLDVRDANNPDNNRGSVIGCRWGKIGDRLWVREAFATAHEGPRPPEGSPIVYRADGGEAPVIVWDGRGPQRAYWRPSIHMPRWASRISLEIVAVRVERLQTISAADALAEGVTPVKPGDTWQFERLWDTINGKRAPWTSNPWVWVLEFKRLPVESPTRPALTTEQINE